MAHLLKKALQLSPNQLLYQQKRYRGKINLLKPHVYYPKSVVEKLLTPFFVHPNVDKTIDELCAAADKKSKMRRLNAYEKIIAKEVRNWFDHSKMIACLHVNSMQAIDVFDVEVELRKVNMYYKRYGRYIFLEAVKGTPYEELTRLLGFHTAFVFSPDINVGALEKILKTSQKIFLLGGALEGYIFRYGDFVKYGTMDITTAQMGLVQVLQNAGGVNLNQQLTHHPSTLVTRLKQIGTNETSSNENEQSVPV